MATKPTQTHTQTYARPVGEVDRAGQTTHDRRVTSPHVPDPTATSLVQDEPASGAAPAVRIRLKVVPGSRKEQIVGPLGDRLKIKVAAPPEQGKANQAVCELLARALGVDTRRVEIVAGLTNPEKVARVEGVSEAMLKGQWWKRG